MFVLTKKTSIVTENILTNEADFLQGQIFLRFGFAPQVASGKKANVIKLQIDEALKDSPEHYTLEVNQKQIIIKGATPAAVFDAIQTLDQWFINNAHKTNESVVIKSVKINDSPRFGYRALMLDPARHFLPINDVKKFIDEMVRYKFNVLQLHLSDDQGWRIEIKSHPELTSSGEYYTQQEIRDLIEYAQKRHVEIVPETDIPGHTYALLKTHRGLTCDCVNISKGEETLRTDVMLCASQEESYSLVKDILTELCDLFPSQYLHLGGDESLIEKNWGKCRCCQELKNKLGFEENNQLMGYFFGHFWDMLRAKGKKPILWMEMDEIMPPANRYLFNYPKDVTLVTWRSGLTPKAIELSAQGGNSLIMAPGEHCYFDYPQYKNDFPEFNNWGMPILTLEQAYNWNPSYPELSFPSEHIQGVMGTLWGEAIVDINRAFYMAYPRAMALAEAGWSNNKPENGSFDNFLKRLKSILSDMIGRGISFRVPYEAYQK